MAAERFDIIVAGAGLSGSMLLRALDQAGLGGARVLLVDRRERQEDDRTWCFWETRPGPFEPLVSHTWEELRVFGPAPAHPGRRLQLAPYRYKMIRAGDFYQVMGAWLEARPQVERLTGEIEAVGEEDGQAFLRLGGRHYRADWVFDAVHMPSGPPPEPYRLLLQHFLGWEVQTTRDRFDPGCATFMDFRVPQLQGTCFVYLLPTSPREALVEYTVFSEHPWPTEAYEAQLRDYLSGVVGVDDYRVVRTETGVIPMTDRPFAARRGERVIAIGTAAGMVKPSTGYAFGRVWQHAKALASALASDGRPWLPTPRWSRHAWMDAVLLRALAAGELDGAAFFSRLLLRNPPPRVLDFLDERSRLAQELAIMATVFDPVLLRHGWEASLGRLRVRPS